MAGRELSAPRRIRYARAVSLAPRSAPDPRKSTGARAGPGSRPVPRDDGPTFCAADKWTVKGRDMLCNDATVNEQQHRATDGQPIQATTEDKKNLDLNARFC